MSSGATPIPGWYPDPHDPSQLRYWDGRTWTESTTPAYAQPQPGMAGSGQVPFPARPGPAYSPIAGQPYGVAAPGSSSGFGDVGPWLSSMFSVLVSRILALVLLLFIVPAIGWLLILLLGRSIVASISYNQITDEFEGAELGRLVAVGAVIAVAAVIGAIGWSGAVHQLYTAHAGQDRSIGRSLQIALRRFPRIIGWGLVYSLLVALGMVLVIGPVVLLVSLVGLGGLFLLVLMVPLTLVAIVWLGVKLAFVPTALVVAPAGANPFSTSWRISEGRWMATFGRILLIWAVVFGISLFTNIGTQFLAVATPTANIEIDPVTEDVIVDGENISNLDVIDFEVFLPNPAVMVAFAVMFALSQAINQSLQISGLAGLYYRGEGAADPDL